MARPIDENIIKNAILKLQNYDNISIVFNDDNVVIYKNEDGLKEKKNKYEILRDRFSPFSHSLRADNEFCVYNANVLANKNNKNKYGSYVMSIEKQYATIKCGNCGNIYIQKVRDFIKDDCLKICKECYSHVHIGKRLDEKKVFEDIRKMGYEILPNQHYKECHKKIGIKTTDGYKGEICYSNIMNGSKISPFAKYNVYALENIRHYCKLNGIESNIPNQKYKGWDLPLKVECSCGNIFKTTFTHFYDGKTSCDYCTKRQSAYETIVENWLRDNEIKYEKQYKYKDCFHKKELPFDFYICDYNTLIEVDGEGHFMPIRFNGTSTKKAEKKFNDTKRNDEIKTKYCNSKGINLVRISYMDIKDKNYINILQNLFIEK